jgi:putative SOS response-associated peptidase YedK
MIDKTGNLPLFPGIFPDYSAPIVRNSAEGRELVLARWGMPSPVFALKGRNSDSGVTNVRNVASPHWRRWLGVEKSMRCAVDQLFRERGLARWQEAASLVCLR